MEEKKEEKKEEAKKNLAKTRCVFLSGRVDEKVSRQVIEDFIRLERESPLEDIFLYIDSYGGYLDSMFAIIDMMNLVHCDVQTICIGKAVSAAALILSNGAKNKRFITPNARTMIHQLFAFTLGTASEIEEEAKEIKRLQLLMEKIFSKNTGHPRAVIEADLKKSKYMSAEESLRYGLVDGIRRKALI